MAQLREGDLLDGRYRIGATIAHGGMSTVYRATDLRLDREVAAKVMDPRFVNDLAFRTRFEREARSVAHMSDESLVNVYDQGTDANGHVFLIMELVDGGTLRELLRERGPMPPHAATAVMRPVLRALSLAHSQDLVHRDIKPENVLISDSGKVKLADFGLVRAVADAKITSNSVIVGTVAYLSPEQVTGAPVHPESDVYSAGILLFELLTGSTPFDGDSSLGIALKRLNEPVPPPSEFIDGVPPEFDELVAQACARNPEDRFSDAAEFAEALEDIAHDLGLPPFRVPAPENSAAHRAAAFRTEVYGQPYPAESAPAPQRDFPPAHGVPGSDQQGLRADGYGEDEPDQLEHSRLSFDNPSFQTRETAFLPDRAHTTHTSAPEPPNRFQPRRMEPRQAQPDELLPPDVPSSHSSRSGQNRPGRQRTRRGCALWLVIALIATLGMGLGAWWLGSGRYGEVPSITGLSQPQAEAAITEAGFTAVTKEEYHDSVPKAQVIGTDPDSGEQVVRGNPVSLRISLGRPTVPAVPADHSAARFSTLLSQRTLVESIGESEYSDSVPEGAVVRSEPASGETVPVGSTVVVHLSKGVAPVKVPDVTGLTLKDAESRLESSGLTVAGVEKRFVRGAKAQEVLSISPEAGTGLEKGSDVTLTVNSGIEVARVVGLDEDEAKQRLEEAGFTVETVKVAKNSSRDYGKVDRVSPAPGSVVDPEDAKVTLEVSRSVEVPSLLGKTISEARDELTSRGLKLNANGNASDDERVITQSPRSGTRVQRGDSVKVRSF